MSTRIAIDLNVRVNGGQTYAGFEDIEGEMPMKGELVVVYERESNVSGKAEVAEIDVDRQLIYLHVDWSALFDHSVMPIGAVMAPGTLTQATAGIGSRTSFFGETQAAVTSATR